VILLVWMKPSEEDATGISEPQRALPAWVAPVQLLFALGIALVAGWFAVSGAARLLERSNLPSMSIIAALLLGPALVIPMIGTDSLLAQHGRYTEAVSSQAGFVVLSLCFMLPLLIVGWYVQSALPLHSLRELWMRWQDVQITSPLNFPLIVWRVDSVMLILLALALLPMSLGRWLPRRAEGIVLILLYAAYMLLWRWGTEIG
jgi:Ca2+/Na+ antiporter